MPTPTGRKSTKTKESFSRTSRHTYSSRVPPGATSGPAVKGEIDQSMRSTYIDRRSAVHIFFGLSMLFSLRPAAKTNRRLKGIYRSQKA